MWAVLANALVSELASYGYLVILCFAYVWNYAVLFSLHHPVVAVFAAVNAVCIRCVAAGRPVSEALSVLCLDALRVVLIPTMLYSACAKRARRLRKWMAEITMADVSYQLWRRPKTWVVETATKEGLKRVGMAVLVRLPWILAICAGLMCWVKVFRNLYRERKARESVKEARGMSAKSVKIVDVTLNALNIVAAIVAVIALGWEGAKQTSLLRLFQRRGVLQWARVLLE